MRSCILRTPWTFLFLLVAFKSCLWSQPWYGPGVLYSRAPDLPVPDSIVEWGNHYIGIQFGNTDTYNSIDENSICKINYFAIKRIQCAMFSFGFTVYGGNYNIKETEMGEYRGNYKYYGIIPQVDANINIWNKYYLIGLGLYVASPLEFGDYHDLREKDGPFRVIGRKYWNGYYSLYLVQKILFAKKYHISLRLELTENTNLDPTVPIDFPLDEASFSLGIGYDKYEFSVKLPSDKYHDIYSLNYRFK